MSNKQQPSYKWLKPINCVAEEAEKPQISKTQISDVILKAENICKQVQTPWGNPQRCKNVEYGVTAQITPQSQTSLRKIVCLSLKTNKTKQSSETHPGHQIFKLCNHQNILLWIPARCFRDQLAAQHLPSSPTGFIPSATGTQGWQLPEVQSWILSKIPRARRRQEGEEGLRNLFAAVINTSKAL